MTTTIRARAEARDRLAALADAAGITTIEAVEILSHTTPADLLRALAERTLARAERAS